jgi:hypothetical protein
MMSMPVFSNAVKRLGCACLLLAGQATLAQAVITEAQAKAAFVLNFARYVEWPASAFATRDAALVICLVGRDGLGSALSALEGRQVQGRPIKVRLGVAQDDAHACHVVFVSEPDERRALPILRALAGLPILSVSDLDRFIDIGGAIGIVIGDNRLQFEVNRVALEQANVKASASLLRLARNIN